jgi:uncharacterized protein (DUF305 family)
MTEAERAVIAAARELVANVNRSGGMAHSVADLEAALEELDNDTCSATMPHHHGALTCTRPNGHEGRHRDYLRGEWNLQVFGPDSLTERLNR